MRRFLQVTGLILIVAFAGIQFVRPEKTNPSTDPANVLRAPRNVQAILKRSCYDCHSNETRWPWYSNLAPMSWTLVEDVEEGRDEMSFSEWNTYAADRRAHLLEEICEVVEKGEMPLKPYALMHPRARITIEDKRALCVWANQERRRLGARQRTSSPTLPDPRLPARILTNERLRSSSSVRPVASASSSVSAPLFIPRRK